MDSREKTSRRSVLRTILRIWPLVLGITLMGVIGAVNVYVLSGVRAYVNGESSWSKGQRDAILSLQAYARTRDPRDYARYEARIAVPRADEQARLALERDPPDLERARAGFLGGRVNEEDLSSVVLLFRVFGDTALFADSVAAWRRADALVVDVDALAQRLRARVSAPVPDEGAIDAIARELVAINLEMGPLTDRFSEALGIAARKTALILHVVTAACALMFLILGVWLVHRLVGRSELVEREREAARRELDIAKTIQSSILLRSPSVPGFETAGGMLAAGEVGGDYYDVLAAPEGCWLAVGDVSGHGLNAGLIAMMTQSAVSALVSRAPDAAPAELVENVNHVLYDNIHGRLATDDFMTFALLRCHGDGRVEYAGAHEAILVVRASDGRCEVIDVIGAWLGVRPTVKQRIAAGTLTLEPGDTLLLYSDGITEAMDERRKMFGTDGIEVVVQALAGASPPLWVSGVLDAAQRWAGTVRDDMTVVVLRYAPTRA